MLQKSRDTSNVIPIRWVAVPNPASQRNAPSHSTPSPSVVRAPSVGSHVVPATGRSAQPIATNGARVTVRGVRVYSPTPSDGNGTGTRHRSEEHTSELQS